MYNLEDKTTLSRYIISPIIKCIGGLLPLDIGRIDMIDTIDTVRITVTIATVQLENNFHQ